MKLLFKQRLFSWLDSYDVYNENEETLFTVKGRLAFGHCLDIYTADGNLVGTVKEEVFTFLPRFCIYENDSHIGTITKEFTLFTPRFTLDFNDWVVEGDFFEWDYRVMSAQREIMQASRQLWNFTDTYILDIAHEEDALHCLMIVLAIDAAKCSSNS
ncbi:MAG: hypothetical protein RR814_05905 [Oscillospiraceae bacterium]